MLPSCCGQTSSFTPLDFSNARRLVFQARRLPPTANPTPSPPLCCPLFDGVQQPRKQALPMLMPTFDREIARLAERLLIKSRPIDYRLGVFASEVIPGIPGEKPVTIKMIDAGTKEHVETIEVRCDRSIDRSIRVRRACVLGSGGAVVPVLMVIVSHRVTPTPDAGVVGSGAGGVDIVVVGHRVVR